MNEEDHLKAMTSNASAAASAFNAAARRKMTSGNVNRDQLVDHTPNFDFPNWSAPELRSLPIFLSSIHPMAHEWDRKFVRMVTET